MELESGSIANRYRGIRELTVVNIELYDPLTNQRGFGDEVPFTHRIEETESGYLLSIWFGKETDFEGRYLYFRTRCTGDKGKSFMGEELFDGLTWETDIRIQGIQLNTTENIGDE